MARVKRASPEIFPALPSASNRQPAPSASYASYASIASGRAAALQGKVAPYLAMVLDPHSKDKGARYPDETIVPTGLNHLAASASYTIPDGGSTFVTGLRWKCSRDTPGGADTAPILTAAPTYGSGDWSEYGTPQTTWASLSAVDRTLAAGIRVRLVGLPTSTFLPAGTVYFLQLQSIELGSLPLTEAAAIQAVTAGKGFSCTVNELSKTDGITLPYLPQGPMSFVFSDTDSEAPVTAGSTSTSTVVSANGFLFVIGFGLQAGQTLRFDYAHHIEYIPRSIAAGIVATRVEPPSAELRDAISRGAQAIQSSLAGATSASKVQRLVDGGASAILPLAKVAMNMVPGGRLLAAGGAALSSSLGGPSWLTSALSALA